MHQKLDEYIRVMSMRQKMGDYSPSFPQELQHNARTISILINYIILVFSQRVFIHCTEVKKDIVLFRVEARAFYTELRGAIIQSLHLGHNCHLRDYMVNEHREA